MFSTIWIDKSRNKLERKEKRAKVRRKKIQVREKKERCEILFFSIDLLFRGREKSAR